jgi:hypothetical protein
LVNHTHLDHLDLTLLPLQDHLDLIIIHGDPYPRHTIITMVLTANQLLHTNTTIIIIIMILSAIQLLRTNTTIIIILRTNMTTTTTTSGGHPLLPSRQIPPILLLMKSWRKK